MKPSNRDLWHPTLQMPCRLYLSRVTCAPNTYTVCHIPLLSYKNAGTGLITDNAGKIPADRNPRRHHYHHLTLTLTLIRGVSFWAYCPGVCSDTQMDRQADGGNASVTGRVRSKSRRLFQSSACSRIGRCQLLRGRNVAQSVPDLPERCSCCTTAAPFLSANPSTH